MFGGLFYVLALAYFTSEAYDDDLIFHLRMAMALFLALADACL